MITVKKHWLQLDNQYYLLADTQELGIEIPCRKFKVYDIYPGNEPILELNKKLKEFDLIEYIRTKSNRKDIQLI